MAKSFGQLLAHALASCNMTKNSFSTRSGILPHMLRRMLRDEAFPSVESFARIHEVLLERLPRTEAHALIDEMMAAVRSDPRFQHRKERRSHMGALRYERYRGHQTSRQRASPTAKPRA